MVLMDLNINKILFAMVLIAVFTAGAFLSYLWVVGYYVSLQLKAPEKPILSIGGFLASAEDPSFFNITILNPSFSPSETYILEILVLTEDNVAHKIASTSPAIPSGGYKLNVGDSLTLKCSWSWLNYVGQQINIVVLVREGTGGALRATLPTVELSVTSVVESPERGDHLNITVVNSNVSVASVNLAGVEIIVDGALYEAETEPNLPIKLEPGVPVSLICRWNWADHQNKTITIIARTSQGYVAKAVHTLPVYANLVIQGVEFNPTNTTYFNITILNSESSLIPLTITSIEITLENSVLVKPTSIIPSLPFMLDVNMTATFLCEWDWSAYRGKEISIGVLTEQSYRAKITYKIP